jgi:alanine dehydrogenase
MARPAAAIIAVIGAGAQADLVLRGLRVLRPLERLVVCDLDPARAQGFAEAHASGHPALVTEDAREAACGADIVAMATWSRVPLLGTGDLAPGTHVTSLGADEPGKAELSPALLQSARVVVDDTRLALTSGALGTAGLSARDAVGTMSDVLLGTIPGRTSDAEITVYTPVGLPWQDLALAWTAYQQALKTGIGNQFDFLA